MEKLLDKLIELISILVGITQKQVTTNGKEVDVTSADYEDSRGFFIRVGGAGNVEVVYFDQSDDAVTVPLENVEGDCPHKLRIIKTGAGTTATNIVVSIGKDD